MGIGNLASWSDLSNTNANNSGLDWLRGTHCLLAWTMVKLNDLFFFVQVVDRQGFAAAARALGLPKSSISKRVAELEKDLGVRLIQRTTRRFAVTEAGQDFYGHAAAALLEAEAAEEAVKTRLAEPRGLVRITASMSTMQMAVAELLPELSRRYPKIQVAVTVTTQYVDLVQEGFDLAIRLHHQPLPDSELVQRRLGFSPNLLVASPDYLAIHGRPERPEELERHFGIFVDPGAPWVTWRLCHADGREAVARPTPKLFADDPFTTLQSALSGLVIANMPQGLAWPHVQAGRLVHLLPHWSSGGGTMTMVMPHRRGQLPAVRAVVDFLAEGMARKMAFS